MTRLTLLLALLLIFADGCVISPRRTVGSTTGGGGNSEFSLSASPTSQVITAGASATFTISVTAVNGFTGTVSLSSSTAGSNIIASFDTTSISGGSGSAVLTVSTTSATPSGNATITVTATDTKNSVSQNISVTAAVQGGASTAGASTMGALISAAGNPAPAGCTSASASANPQRVSFPTTPATHGFTATFAATPSSSPMDASLGFFAPASNLQPPLSSLIHFSPAGVIQVRDGEAFTPTIPYAAGETYQFRLAGNLPAASYSVFVTPPGAAEIPLAIDLQVPSTQRGATTLGGWGILANAPDSATISVCNFSLR